MSDTDLELLARYTGERAEDAFAEIVRRHLDLVHSAALRQLRSPQLAEEVAQSTFISLARHAHRLAPDTILAAWLYQVTRREAIDVIRREARRHAREQIATEMNATNANAAEWAHVEPVLDEAMHALDDTDRAAVLLRYFENKSLREVGRTLGTSENAAQKRLSRAVERLRQFFAKRGVSVGAGGLVVAITTHAVQAAPAGMGATITTGAATFGLSAATQTSTLTKGTLLMASTQQKAVLVTLITVLLAIGGAAVLTFNRSQEQSDPRNLSADLAPTGLSGKELAVRWVAEDGDIRSPADVLPVAGTGAAGEKLRVLKDVVLDGSDVESASLSNDQGEVKEFLLLLNNQGAQKFAEATARNIGRRLAVVWNGRVINAPIIRSAVSGPNVKVTGTFSDGEAQMLLEALNHR